MIFNFGEIHGSHARQKDKQKAIIFSYLVEHAPVTRKDMTKNLRLRSTTVSNVVQELIEDHLVVEGESKTPGRPGRPDFGLRPVLSRLVAITVYVEDHMFIGSLIDIKGNILSEEIIRVSAEGANNDVTRALEQIIYRLKKDVPQESEFLGISVSVVGTVDSANLIWVNADRWPKIKNLNIGVIAERNGTVALLRRNLDIELEYMLEKNPDWKNENTVLFHWGFGVGGAYAYKGRVLDSPLGRYMDIGHTIIHPNSKKKCRCGVCGCVESEAAIYALLPLLRREFPNLKEESVDIDRILSDSRVLDFPGIKQAVKTVGLCLSNLFKIFYPHRMLLVGAFMRNEKIVEQLEKIILETFYNRMKDKVHKVDLVAITDGFKGCTWANSYPFFRKRLQELLTSRN
jgi:predicted NBD/HSP70 family sugar kinase